MGAADTLAGSKSGQAKNENIVAQGQSEIAEGMARLKGHPTEPITAGAGTEAQRPAGDQPPPPPPKDSEQTKQAPQKDPIHEQPMGGSGATGPGAGPTPQTQQSVRFSAPQQTQTGSESAQGRKGSETETGAESASVPQDQSTQGQRTQSQPIQTEASEQSQKGQKWLDAGHEQQSPSEGTQAASEPRGPEGAQSNNQGLIGQGADAPQGPGSSI
ncbi:hypothetical protein PAXINDRAFT_15420 [Paxillus involutus ATCC 200175]|uniref:Uncharacterized protein n=1 Tax=Paxillus involutus ATCC 200175 TaxID=664439 RepID=A0A0C9TVG7_PAXIN|nr:hypothetical protein PAXINDRAFT_15420 [Paxillus involutus ATCC 200175]